MKNHEDDSTNSLQVETEEETHFSNQNDKAFKTEKVFRQRAESIYQEYTSRYRNHI